MLLAGCLQILPGVYLTTASHSAMRPVSRVLQADGGIMWRILPGSIMTGACVKIGWYWSAKAYSHCQSLDVGDIPVAAESPGTAAAKKLQIFAADSPPKVSDCPTDPLAYLASRANGLEVPTFQQHCHLQRNVMQKVEYRCPFCPDGLDSTLH